MIAAQPRRVALRRRDFSHAVAVACLLLLDFSHSSAAHPIIFPSGPAARPSRAAALRKSRPSPSASRSSSPSDLSETSTSAFSSKFADDRYSPDNPFLFWLDAPGSERYSHRRPNWYDLLETSAGQSFTSTDDVTVNVNWGDHQALHLWADPSFQQTQDEAIRKTNGPSSNMKTGTIDSCGWPDLTPDQAPDAIQYTRSTEAFVDTFENGLDPEKWVVQYGFKACCNQTDISANLDIVLDDVDGQQKPVLAIKAVALDSDACTTGHGTCKKIIYSSGSISTAEFFGSGKYEVIAKVPSAPGAIWAVWTYHYEPHLPQDCSDYTCFCGDWGSQGCPNGECMPEGDYKTHGCPATNGCEYRDMCDSPYWSGSKEEQCAKSHSVPDEQFPGSASFTSFVSQMNHEIDIEIPANCMNTPNVCNDPNGACTNDYSTANLNNYIATNNNGAGPSYSNMCVRVTDKHGDPVMMAGDDKYHNYTIEWHTGDSSTGGKGANSYVNFYVDGIYMGTNNAFVPTRGSRFWMSLWPSSGLWNGYPDNWNGGSPGDGKTQVKTAYVSSVSITPYNEPNDIMYPTPVDQPDGCKVYYSQYDCHKWKPVSIPTP